MNLSKCTAPPNERSSYTPDLFMVLGINICGTWISTQRVTVEKKV